MFYPAPILMLFHVNIMIICMAFVSSILAEYKLDILNK